MEIKSLLLIIILFEVFFFSCKKDPKIESQKNSERYMNLVTHKWLMTHQYVDSTSYAKNNLNLWPFSTTDDFMSINDSCALKSETQFLPNGKCQLLKSASCDSSISSDVGYWKLINNENDFVFVGQDTMHIVELTDSDFKMWYKIKSYSSGILILTEYCMWTFKSSN